MNLSRLALCLLFLAQFALFRQYAIREIVPAYPTNFDQAAYLYTDYALYRDALQQGPFRAINHYLHQSHPTGWMLPLQETLLHLFFGPGRLSALLLNFGYLILLQVVLFHTARWLTGRAALGWAAVGLLMMQLTAFLPAGGMFDCRIDFIVYCLYGIFTCFLVRSDGLRETRWLAAAGGCALLLFCFRFIAFSYLLGFCTTLFTALLALRLGWPGRRRDKLLVQQAMGRTAFFGVVCTLVGGVVIALNWQAIHDYYVVGHLTGDEKHIRAAEAGITSLGAHLTFYFSALWKKHLGLWFIVAWVVLAAVGFALGKLRAGEPGRGGSDRPRAVQFLVIGSSLFAPWFILTLDESKSALVANVFVVPVTLLLLVLLAAFHRRRQILPDRAGLLHSRVWTAVAVAVLALGAGNWVNRLARAGSYHDPGTGIQNVGKLYDLLGDEAERFGLKTPKFMVDVVMDWAQPVTLNASLFERSGRWLNFGCDLPPTIFAVTREQVRAAMGTSDFILLTDFPKVGTYPFLESMRLLGPEMRAWCDLHLLRVRDFAIRGGQVSLYKRVDAPQPEGLAGGWISPAGIRLRLPREVLEWMRVNGKSSLAMQGNYNAWLPRPPSARAEVETMDGWPIHLDCAAKFTVADGTRYRLTVNLQKLLTTLPATADVFLNVHLDGSYFVPREAGLNQDERQLIVTGPDAVEYASSEKLDSEVP